MAANWVADKLGKLGFDAHVMDLSPSATSTYNQSDRNSLSGAYDMWATVGVLRAPGGGSDRSSIVLEGFLPSGVAWDAISSNAVVNATQAWHLRAD